MTTRPPVSIDYTSRDYSAIKADLVKLITQQLQSIQPTLQWDADDPSDFGVVIMEMFAYMGTIMSAYIDKVANETSIDNAALKSTLYNMSQLYGYRPSGPTQAVVSLTVTNNSGSSINLPAGTQCVANLPYGSVNEVFFETTAEVTNLAPGASTTVDAIEGATANTTTADGISPTTHLPLPVLLVDSYGSAVSSGLPNQERVISDTGIVDGSVKVYVGQGESFKAWRFVDNLVESTPLDNVYTTKINADNTTSVVFGDGVNGAIPPSGHIISALYVTSVGYAGNVDASAIDEVTFIPGSSLDVSLVSVSNPEKASGGADADSVSQIKAKLKKAILSRSRAVTLADYEALASIVPRVGRAKAYSVDPRLVIIYAQTQNDGTISPGWDLTTNEATAAWDAMKASIEEYLSDKIQIGTSVVVTSPTYVDLKLDVTVTAASNYRNTEVQKAVENALINPTSGYFSYDNLGFGDTVDIYDVAFAIRSVPGVAKVNINILDRNSNPTPGSADVVLSPFEIARLLYANLKVTVSGGLV